MAILENTSGFSVKGMYDTFGITCKLELGIFL